MLKTCERPGCGNRYRTKPSHAARRRFCSVACFALMQRRRESRNCASCGLAIGERRLSDPTRYCWVCASIARGITLKRIGHRPVLSEADERKRLRSKEHRERTSKLHKGRRRTTPLAARFSPVHKRARHFVVSSPARRIYCVDNISAFVKKHRNMFLPADTKKRRPGSASYECRATHGLSTIGRGHRGSWKGWTLVGGL
jgi:hypothetical protein